MGGADTTVVERRRGERAQVGRRYGQRLVGLAGASLVLAACASTPAPKPTPKPDPTTSTTAPAPTTTTTTIPVAKNPAAVIAGAIAETKAYYTAAEDMSSVGKGIHATSTPLGARLTLTVLGDYQRAGIQFRLEGPFDLGHPKVAFTGPDTATITTCLDNDLIGYSVSTGKPVQNVLGQFDMTGEVVQMKLVDGRWLYDKTLVYKNFPYDGGHGTCPGFGS